MTSRNMADTTHTNNGISHLLLAWNVCEPPRNLEENQTPLNITDSLPYFWEISFSNYFMAICNYILGVMGFFGNLLIITVILRKSSRSSIDIYLLNLGIADWIFNIIGQYFRNMLKSIFNIDVLKYDPILCKFYFHSMLGIETISGFCIVAVTIQRCFSVVRPFHALQSSQKKVTYFCYYIH